LGCGTTSEAAQKLRRNSVGIEIISDYVKNAKSKIKPVEHFLFEKMAKYEGTKKRRNR
jgi:site-specific DNA-methyltransferase (adenine-specific)/site-specific DNA-methyltransferase (cytosine-N4-specific)